LFKYVQIILETMKRLLILSLAVPFAISCTTNAVTGRKQLQLFPESTLQAEAVNQYQSFLSQNKVVSASNSRDAEMVRRVGGRIASAITSYYSKQASPVDLSGYKWEFNLVSDPAVNAWCMPGGKVVVYTGLLPVTQNEAALAVVLAHEITHAIAQHGNERMSQGAIAQGLQVAGNIFTQNRPQANALFNNIYGPGVTVGAILPNSRKQEYEADRFGLIFTAMAGYNPQEAIPFWERMAAASDGNKPPQMLSSHPTDENRIAQLKKYMPEALRYYKPIRR
jgi:predicted Zn-dependent protease